MVFFKNMKSTAIAPSNIAFIKFFGKTNDELRLPANSSISMCLSAATTTTTVEFSSKYNQDIIEIVGDRFSDKERIRISSHIDRIRKIAKVKQFAKVITQNSFPKSSGIASSASGFAALTLAASSALGLSLTDLELTVHARLGSGSAARSIPDGFVQWNKGEKSNNSFAYSLYSPNHWNILDILVVLEDHPKSVSTTDAHKLAATSPFYKQRIAAMDEKIEKFKQTLKKRDFTSFGKIVEEEAFNMHAVMMTTTPSLLYWSAKTVELISAVWEWRQKGLSVYFTIDAGANVHLICEEKNQQNVVSAVNSLKIVKSIMINKPSKGARLINQHLF